MPHHRILLFNPPVQTLTSEPDWRLVDPSGLEYISAKNVCQATKVNFRANEGLHKMRPVNKIQILIGVIGLLFGSLVYLIDRPPDQTYFVYSTGITISLYSAFPNLFGLIATSLPAFIHVFLFILLTAGFVSYRKRGYLIICLCWFLVDCAFELGQRFSSWSLKMIPDWFAGIPLLENTEGFFLQGTFDFIDLAAVALGTLIAYFVLRTTSKRREIS